MLQIAINDFLYLFPIIICISNITLAFFKFNTPTTFVKNFTKDKKKIKTNISKKNYIFVFLRFIIVLVVLLIIELSLYHGWSGTFWNNHFYINNFFHKYILFFYKISFFLLVLIYCLLQNRINFSVDYIYIIAVTLIISPLIFISNNFFIFYFILEFLVCATFLVFTVSKFWFKSSLTLYNKKNTEKYNNFTPKMYINALFFQYWASFFSSLLIIYFFLNIEFYFNTTEWTFINFSSKYAELPATFYIYFYFFIFSFFLKLGITPMHLYKIEVYKGLPFISLYIYTIIFFFIYYFYFTLLVIIHFSSFKFFFFFVFTILILVGILFIIILLFDVNFMKGFFAYSTVINSVSFLLIILAFF